MNGYLIDYYLLHLQSGFTRYIKAAMSEVKNKSEEFGLDNPILAFVVLLAAVLLITHFHLHL